MLYQKACAEKERLRKSINEIEKKLKKLPDGNMFISHNGKYLKWYYRLKEDEKAVYIPKKNRKLAESYAQKKYLLKLKDDLTKEINALDYYLRHHRIRPWDSDVFLAEKPEYLELLSPYFKPKDKELSEWADEPYVQNPYHPEELIQKLPDGKYVRSKSEVMIAMVLQKYKIPFRVENPVEIEGTCYYPDFTIRHPQTGEYYYMEHFGLMDDSRYIYKTVKKLCKYAKHGIVPMENLIMTFETKKHPLTIERVEYLIKEYFL